MEENEAKKEQQTQPPLFDQLKEYAEIRFKLAKYQAVDGGSAIFASLIADVVVAISMLLAFVFASFTLAFYLAEVLQSYWGGFGCVALLYLLIATFIKVYKRTIEKPIANAFVRKIFKNRNND
ncbi:MAG: phage holin family protein [Mucilaginibacter sp.]|nr:phage holin family protein [Mucilaginibacter sp.]